MLRYGVQSTEKENGKRKTGNGKRKGENGELKSASKREQSQARLNYAEREQIQDDKVGLKLKTIF